MAVNPMSFQMGGLAIIVPANQPPAAGVTPRDDLYRLNITGAQKTEMEPLFVKIEELLAQNGERLLLANAYKEIGDKLEPLKLHQDAINYFQKALEIYRQIYGENHEEVAYCYYSIGWDLKQVTEKFDNAKIKESIDLFQKALDIRLPLFGEQHRKVAACYFELGWGFCNIGTIEFKTNSFGSQMHKFAAEKIHTAIDYGRKALEIYRQFYEENPRDVVKVYRLLENCSRALALDGGQTVHLGGIRQYGDLAGSIEQAIDWKKPLPVLPGGPKKASEGEKCAIS